MRKIYKLYIGIILSVIAVACSDNLDSDKYFKDRRSLEDVFTDKESTEEWLAHAYSFLGGYNLEVSNMYNRQIKKFPTEKQNVSLKHILT